MIKPFGDGRDWFFRKRFGMFIHWGLYAIPAWHEQILWRGDVKRRAYEKLVDEFNPRRFNPDAWLDVLQEAGMEYLCVTTKHHDGFCLWDTAYTDYNVMRSPYGKDIIGMLAEACHRRGVVARLLLLAARLAPPALPQPGPPPRDARPAPGRRAGRGQVPGVRGQPRCASCSPATASWASSSGTSTWRSFMPPNSTA